MEDGKVMSKLNVLYEDNHIIVVEKPANVLSQGDATGDLDLLTMVKQYVKENFSNADCFRIIGDSLVCSDICSWGKTIELKRIEVIK